jgi:hypothetical protein
MYYLVSPQLRWGSKTFALVAHVRIAFLFFPLFKKGDTMFLSHSRFKKFIVDISSHRDYIYTWFLGNFQGLSYAIIVADENKKAI